MSRTGAQRSPSASSPPGSTPDGTTTNNTPPRETMMKVRVLAGFVDARANFRSFVPGDVVDLPKEKAEALASSGHVEVVAQEKPGARRQTKVSKPAETKAPEPTEQAPSEAPVEHLAEEPTSADD
ncbi:hypothetical protein [Agromyces sp. NPDC058064]|uniref:hypothetical protein n=1 Tax=Agromyces sp. NPDC058064 TaxID=3346322 RepID=UPI0036DECD51